MDMGLTFNGTAGLWLSQVGSCDRCALGSILWGQPKNGWLEVGLVEKKSSAYTVQQMHIHVHAQVQIRVYPVHTRTQVHILLHRMHIRTQEACSCVSHSRMCTSIFPG